MRGARLQLPRWRRLGVRISALFVVVTLFAVGLVAAVLYWHQREETEETLSAQVLSVARAAMLLIEVDPPRAARTGVLDGDAARHLRAILLRIQNENRLDAPFYVLTDIDPVARQARVVVASRGWTASEGAYSLPPEFIAPLSRVLREGEAAASGRYRRHRGRLVTGFAPIRDAAGRIDAVVAVDYDVEAYMRRREALLNAVLGVSLVGALGALVVGVAMARRITAPLSTLTQAVARVAAGDLSQELKVGPRNEVGQLTGAFNEMLKGLRQRDLIRGVFGRYVSPEVARTLLEDPEGLRLGGEKREVTILMADLRGYTRFAELGDAARVVEVLNGYLDPMSRIIIEHGGTINEFIGDAIFAIFGAPLAHPDHAERAAVAAIAMQGAMAGVNRKHMDRGLPAFEMGIGINTGEAVVGNIGGEQRAKYAAVGSAVNLAARVEGCAVGGQILLGPATYERLHDIAEVSAPIPVELKGIAGLLLLYELCGIGGRFARRLPEVEAGSNPEVEVALPLVCWPIEGKVVAGESVSGAVLRLGRHHLEVRLDPPLPPLTNVRLRLKYPGLGCDSGDLYGKVVGEGVLGRGTTRIRLTSVDAVDQKIFGALLG